jgi:hypothetical protein
MKLNNDFALVDDSGVGGSVELYDPPSQLYQ